jgi:glutamate-ammonia-ligase adenylyltransferase
MTTESGPALDGETGLDRVSARLVRLGFSRIGDAAALLTSAPLELWDARSNSPTDDAAASIVTALGRSAAPDQAVAALADLAQALGPQGTLRRALAESAPLRARLSGVLGASVGLSEHLIAHPQDWQVLTGRNAPDLDKAAAAVAASVGADPRRPVTGSRGTRASVTGQDAVLALRAAYNREVVAIAGRDLAGEMSVEDVTAALASLAGATLQAGLAVAAAENLAAEADVDFRLAVIAMGKTGGRELNYVSDVDVIFVGEAGVDDYSTEGVDPDAALAAATRLAARLMRICGKAVWEVDAALRPEGNDGALVRTLASHVAYYQRWASTWEFQALLKARPIAGSIALGDSYIEQVGPMVWTAAERPNFVTDVQAMRRRVVSHLPAALVEREIKLGPGGLRDVEFAVQLLQMVHGRGDESLRVPGTLPGLGALRDGGYIGRDDAVSLADAYRFLRATEHRVQLLRLRRTHLVPDDEQTLYRMARSMGFRADHRGDAAEVWRSEWALHSREVRRLHEKLFYRPLLEAVARVPSEVIRMTPQEAERRMAALGFAQPRRGLQHIEALTSGLSRRAAIQKALLPVLLDEFSAAPDPDAGLLRYRRVSDSAGNTPWYLRSLRDEGKVAHRLAYVLGTSQYLADLLVASPDALMLLADDEALRPRSAAELGAAMRAAAARQTELAAAVRAIRAVRRTELVRIASADLLGLTTETQVAAGLSAIMDATLGVTVELIGTSIVTAAGWSGAPARLAVIAMGRLGGSELGYGSDADVLFVYDPTEPADEGGPDPAKFAREVAEQLRALLATPSGDPAVQVDANLRPEGRDGPLVRSLASYAAYYERWASIWECQALLRARPCAGDPELGTRFEALVEALRYPVGGPDDAQVLEIRRLKARIDSERLPRGADPATHAKLGRGGLADVEWTVQLLQLRHGEQVAALRTPSTVAGLRAAGAEGLLARHDAHALIEAWLLASRVRNAIMLVNGKAGDQLPSTGPALVAVGRAMGYPADFEPGQLDDDYRRVTRRARKIVEENFYADGPGE